MMGVGKTTVGKALADHLGWSYFDSDEQVQQATGKTVAEIWRDEGEEAFREQESQVLQEALAEPGPSVIAVAGGAVLDPGNRRQIRSCGTVVWLRADPSVLVDRVASGSHRPLLVGDAEGSLRRLYEEREPIYAALADVVVDVDAVGADEAVEQVVEHLRR